MKKKVGIGVGKITNQTEFEKNIDDVFKQLKDTMINDMDRDKAVKLLYWINDWGADYLKNEKTFNYRDLIRYKRGSVVEADLGFKVGSEQGGLHFCIVLDNRNIKDNRVLLVVPLESLPDNKKPSEIDENYEVFLGYGIFQDDIVDLEKEIKKLENKIEQMEKDKLDASKKKGIKQYLERELAKLKKGSVAQIAQICALSKMRIYTPKQVGDRFSTFQLEESKMLDIEEKLAKLYLSSKYDKDVVNKTNIETTVDAKLTPENTSTDSLSKIDNNNKENSN